MNRIKFVASWFAIILLLGLTVNISPLWSADTDNVKQQKKTDIRKMANDTLERLYKTQPSARKAIENAAGYAAFSNFGMKIFLAGGGSGSGIAVNNKTKQETYMKMLEVQAGLGFGVKKFRLIWVFENQSKLDSFINSGWELGGQTTAAAQMSGQGRSGEKMTECIIRPAFPATRAHAPDRICNCRRAHASPD